MKKNYIEKLKVLNETSNNLILNIQLILNNLRQDYNNKRLSDEKLTKINISIAEVASQ